MDHSECLCELYQARSKREKMAARSSNPVVKGTWRPTVELEPLLSEAKTRKMICGAQTGTAGLGLAPSRRKQDSTADESAQVLRAFESITEHQRYVHCLSLKRFAEWVKCCALNLNGHTGSCLEKMICSVSTLCYQPQVYSNAGIKSQMQPAICARMQTRH